ncbi:MAG: double zinc ribbon domain-containing protein, partial [Candidatus Uhrbacteria bacterium]
MAINWNDSRQAVITKINRFKEAALDAVFPEFCAGCEVEGELLCADCRGAARIDLQAERCPFCERVTSSGATCRKCSRATSLDGCLALAHYAEPAVQGIIKKWKYQFAEGAEHQVAAWIRASNLEQVLPRLPWSVVPASLHEERERWRGFDQSKRLARLIARELGLVYVEALRRRNKTVPQAALGERRR